MTLSQTPVPTPREHIHQISGRLADELAGLITNLRESHIDDLNEQVGFGTLQALERAVYALENARDHTAPAAAPPEPEKPKKYEWRLFELAGAARKLVKSFGSDGSAARTEAATRNTTAFGVSFVAEPVEVDDSGDPVEQGST